MAQANDFNFNLIPWYIGKADVSGIVSTIATVDWTGVIAGVGVCYSGSWFEDSGGTVHLMVPCGPNITNFTVYETHATDSTLTHWSAPVVANNASTDYDPKEWQIGSTFYTWQTNSNTHCIELSSSSALIGGYSMIRTGNWTGWGCTYEGPTLYKDVTGPGTWRIVIERILTQPIHTMWYSDCNNPDFTVCTWTPLQQWHEDMNYRHGSILGPNF